MISSPIGPDSGARRPGAAAVAAILGTSGVLIVATVVSWWADRASSSLLVLDLTAGALSWLLAPLMLWRPVATAVVLTVLAAVSPAATAPAVQSALHVARRRRFPVAVWVAAAGLFAH